LSSFWKFRLQALGGSETSLIVPDKLSSAFVFIEIAGCTFIFKTEVRSQETEARIMTPSARRRLLISDTLAWFLAFGRRTFYRSFVFINIAGCTFILKILSIHGHPSLQYRKFLFSWQESPCGEYGRMVFGRDQRRWPLHATWHGHPALDGHGQDGHATTRVAATPVWAFVRPSGRRCEAAPLRTAP
jgi:hypothetical protein